MKAKMNHKNCWIYTPKKQGGRIYFLSHFKQAVNVYFSFPGITCEDIKNAIKKGVINDRTIIIAIEKDKEVAKHIKAYLDTLPNKYYIHNKDLRYFHNIAAVLNGQKIDCAFFDFCGYVDMHSTDWIIKHHENFADGCIIGYTIDNQYRAKNSDGGGLLEGFLRHCYNRHGVKNQCRKSMKDLKHFDTARNQYDFIDEKRMRIWNRREKYIQISASMVSLMFGVTCNISSVYSYKDNKRHGMSIIMGKLGGKRKNVGFYKLYEYINGLLPKTKQAKKIKEAAKQSKIPVCITKKYKCIEDIKPQQWAWITMKAQKEGKNPAMVKAGIKAAFVRRNNKQLQ